MSGNKYGLLTLLNNIHNRQKEKQLFFIQYRTRLIEAFLSVLLLEGYIVNYIILNDSYIKIYLKYGAHGSPVIKDLRAVSKQGNNIFITVKGLMQLSKLSGDSIYIVTTNLGIKSHSSALKTKVGGMILCKIN
jgi:ribosomal protein S8